MRLCDALTTFLLLKSKEYAGNKGEEVAMKKSILLQSEEYLLKDYCVQKMVSVGGKSLLRL